MKLDGSKVSAHARDGHCRKIERSNYFQDSTKQRFKNIKPRIKKWNATEKKIVQEILALLPPWLSKYYLAEILRGDVGGSPKNPAASFASNRVLLIFDQFFNENNKRAIIIHEMAHIAISSIDPELKLEFIHASGWTIDSDFKPVAPHKLLLSDSKNSIDEDFSNYIETFYVDQARLMTFNPLAFLAIKKIIDSKENEK